MKGALTRPTESGRIRLAWAKPEGIRLKGRHREILPGMKGWRPSAWLGLETGSGSFKRTYSCRTSDRSRCLFSPVLGLLPCGRRVSLSALIRRRGRQVGRRRPSVCDQKTAPALRLVHETWRNGRRRPKERQPARTRSAFSTALILRRPLPKATGLEGCSSRRRVAPPRNIASLRAGSSRLLLCTSASGTGRWLGVTKGCGWEGVGVSP
jgi:hypothetical protein